MQYLGDWLNYEYSEEDQNEFQEILSRAFNTSVECDVDIAAIADKHSQGMVYVSRF